MAEGYDWYLEQKRKAIENTKHAVEEVNKEDSKTVFPQYILSWKMACSELETEEAKCVTIDGKFYFTEKLVNKLMLLSSLMSTRMINEDSYNKGWQDCWENTLKKLGIDPDDYQDV